MGFFSYLTTAAPEFGPLAWLFFLAQVLGTGVGAYLYFAHTERNPARQSFMRQLGLTLLLLGVVGVLLGVLRMVNLPTLNQRVWFWFQALVDLGVAGYVAYYMRSVLPALEQSASARGSKPGAPRALRQVDNSSAVAATPRPVATTGRRDARRDRKRKSR